jgi:hypothetical protein
VLPGISARLQVTPVSRTGGQTAVKVQIAVLSLLAILYLLQMFSPLRLHDDTLRLLSMAESASEGSGFLDHGQATLFPPGYPALVVLLIKLHLAHAWALVGLNLVFIGGGMAALYLILYPAFFRERHLVLTVCIFSLLSFGLIKYSSIPLTESCFFGVVMCSLLVIQSTVAHFSWRNLALSLLSVAAAICVRRAGVAFIPLLFWVVLGKAEIRDRIKKLSTRLKIAAVLLLSGFVAGIIWLVYETSTLRDFTGTVAIQQSIPGAILGLISFRLREFGEMVINLPSAVVSTGMQHLVLIFGGLLVALLLRSIAVVRHQLTAVDVFFISYSLIIMVWPYYCDLRFWMPVIPLIAAYAIRTAQSIWRHEAARCLTIGYAVIYLFIGSLTIVSSVKLSFTGTRFGDIYPDYHETYCAAGYCDSGAFDGAKANPIGVHILRVYR